ncbi:MAG: hypothetical protein KAJ19_09870, partial [Gammaproteobacteria bacterium]|nr:hypothetical protein [Gammaproteobacteria bacterium]
MQAAYSKIKKSGTVTVTNDVHECYSVGDVITLYGHGPAEEYIITGKKYNGGGTYEVTMDSFSGSKAHPLAKAVMKTIIQEEEREEK